MFILLVVLCILAALALFLYANTDNSVLQSLCISFKIILCLLVAVVLVIVGSVLLYYDGDLR